MSIALDKHYEEHFTYTDKNNSFAKAMEQRAIKIKDIKQEQQSNCPGDCRYIKENIHIQLRICWSCKNQSDYRTN